MLTPRLGPEHFKTYAILQPLRTHWRKATCEEVACKHYQDGWVTRLAGNDEENISFITSGRTGRRYRELPRTEAGERVFFFLPGQPCFRAALHRKLLDREPLFVVREGDYRGNPRQGQPAARRVEDWVDDFATHQQGIADAIEKG